LVIAISMCLASCIGCMHLRSWWWLTLANEVQAIAPE
jgi:hypothetical protein